jgi:ABC-type nitrate/sulfonate/bicarbonate transport system substrate-binding protein
LPNRTLALSSSGALPTAIGRAFLNECPGARPQELTMPHSGDRLSALLTGSVDAAVLQRADVARLENEAPGRYRVLGAPASLAHLDLEGVFVSRRLLAERRELAVAYVRERVFANRRVLDDPRLLYEEAARWPNMGRLDDRVVAGEVGAPAWARDGGLSEASLEATIAFFVDTDSLPPSIEPRTSADLSLLADALRAVAENDRGPVRLPDSR